MKKFLLMLTTVFISTTAFGALTSSKSQTAAVRPGIPTAKSKSLGKLPTASKVNSPGMTRAEEEEESGVITQAPDGETVKLLGNSFTFYIYYDEVTQDESYGLAYEAVWTDEGDVYLKNPVSMLDWDTYIKGKATEDGIQFDFPQTIYRADNDGDIYDFCVDVLQMEEIESPYDPDDYFITFVPAEDTRSIVFTKDDDGSYVMEGDYMLGVTYEDEWQGYGEMGMNLTPFDSTPIEIPSGIEYDYSYILADELNGWGNTILRPIGIGEADGVTYISGISQNLPDAVLVGTFDKEANTLTIPSDQFLGEYYNHYLFMMIGTGYSYYDEFWEEDMISFDITEDALVLSYNPEENIFTPVIPEGDDYTYFIFNFGNIVTYPVEYYTIDRIYSQGTITDHSPINPEVIFVSEIDYIDPEYSYSFEFNVFASNQEGQILPDKYIYYNIYVDGELCTFTSDEYPDLVEAGYNEITDIPYNLNVGSDIYASGDYHGVALKRKNVKTLGVKAIYSDGNVRAESEIVTVTNTGEPVGVQIMEGDSTVKTEYYDLTGRKLSSMPETGIYLKRSIFSNGNDRTEKKIR